MQNISRINKNITFTLHYIINFFNIQKILSFLTFEISFTFIASLEREAVIIIFPQESGFYEIIN